MIGDTKMNEEQGDKLIKVLEDIRDLLKPRQEIVEKVIEVRPRSVEILRDFKEFVTGNEFYNTLTEEQKKMLTKQSMANVKVTVVRSKK